MDNQAVARIKDLLQKNEKIGILVGKNPSLDQMAAALSLYLGLKQLGKNPSIASASEPIVANSSLVGINRVETSLSAEGGDLIVSFPYHEGEIEKVSYTLENGYLNIVVKASEEGLSFQQEDVLFKRSGGIPSLLFIVGTPRLSDLGQLFDAELLKDTSIINIDNHPDNQGYGDVALVSAYASSLSELIGTMFPSLGIEVDQDMAQNLLSGIMDGTNNFQNGNTTYLAFTLAGEFLQKGAKRMQVVRSGESKSPYGPFTMPTPRQPKNEQHQQKPWDRQSHGSVQKPFQKAEHQQKPWDRPQQPKASQHHTQSQQASHHEEVDAPHVAPQSHNDHHQQQSHSKPTPIQHTEHKEEHEEQPETPPDWLAPKVYKSSTLI